MKFDNPLPLVAAAIHDGHRLSRRLSGLSGLKESVRFREEDPYTSVWARISGNRIIGRRSRFEYDLNRPPEKAIYLGPDDAWGLDVWKRVPDKHLLEETMGIYYGFYEKVYDGLSGLIGRFGKLVLLDIHSYNHRREGPLAGPGDPQLNPEVNIGTGTMDREYWAPLIDRFMEDLSTYDYLGRRLDVRENVKFRGGYFPRWIHENFPGKVCCISVEVKKIFMDECSDALGSTLPGLLSGLTVVGKPGMTVAPV